MHIVLNEPILEEFLSVAKSFYADGSREFLLYGEVPAVVKFSSLVQLEQLVGISITAIFQEAIDVPNVRVISMESIARDCWDAIIVLPPYSPITLSCTVPCLRLDKNLAYHAVLPNLVVVVSLQKAGTNLVSRLFQRFGYHVTGAGIDNDFPHQAVGYLEYLRSKPQRTCYFLHWLPLIGSDPARNDYPWIADYQELLRFWVQKSSRLPLVFNYRDPRAVVDSLIHYWMKNNFDYSPAIKINSAVLRNLPNHQSRFRYVMYGMPEYLQQSFRNSLWMLYHPEVCTVSFEQLVGPRGGGKLDVQREAVAKLMCKLSIEGEPSRFCEQIFSEDSRTFFRGQVDAWKQDIDADLLAEFSRLYGDILRNYGYLENA